MSAKTARQVILAETPVFAITAHVNRNFTAWKLNFKLERKDQRERQVQSAPTWLDGSSSTNTIALFA